MARFRSTPITSDVQNSIDNQTFSKWRGINVAKKKINENKSEQPKQLQQRARWRKALELEKLFRLSSEIGFPSRPATQDYHNAFLSTNANKRAIEVSEDLEVTVDYPVMQLGNHDDRDLPEQITVTADADAHTLTFTHGAEEYGAYAEPTDRLYAALYNPALRRSVLCELNTRGDTEPVTVNVPSRWEMSDVQVYVFVLSEDGRYGSLREAVRVD